MAAERCEVRVVIKMTQSKKIRWLIGVVWVTRENVAQLFASSQSNILQAALASDRMCRLIYSTGGYRVGKSRKDSLHHISCHIREPEVAALITIGESLVIDAAKVKHRGVEIVHMNLFIILDKFVAQLIR